VLATVQASRPQIIEKQVEGVTVPVYPGNSASILAAKDGPVKDRRLAAGVSAASLPDRA